MPARPELDEAILAALRAARQPLLSREIADQLSRSEGRAIDRAEVNRALYGEALKRLVAQDSSYKWSLRAVSAPGGGGGAPRQVVSSRRGGGYDPAVWDRFTRAASYFLECVREDQGLALQFFLSDENKKFVSFPGDQEWSGAGGAPTQLALGQEASFFRSALREGAQSASLYYGYPLYVRWVSRSKKGWTGGFALPVFLLPVEVAWDGAAANLRLTDDWPRVNPSFLEAAFSSTEERRDFVESLGLLTLEGAPPEGGLGEVAQRMAAFVSIVEERESIAPEQLDHLPRVAGLSQGGLYNRAILALGERSKYTRSLEYELEQLSQRVPIQSLESSALRVFFDSQALPPAQPAPSEILEVVGLNDEQRAAVASAFSEPLTVVTGPPGTGKSQVVTTILANAYVRGLRVLFTSRNHKAIDVVEARTNGLTSVPILIRAGGKAGERDLRRELVDFLTRALSISATEEDRLAYAGLRVKAGVLQAARDKLWRRLEELRRERNLLDEEDLELAEIETEFPDEVWSRIAPLTSRPEAPDLQGAMDAAHVLNRRDLGLVGRLSRWWNRRELLERVGSAGAIAGRLDWVGQAPAALTREAVDEWANYLDEVHRRISAAGRWVQFRQHTEKLSSQPGITQLALELSDLESRLWETSGLMIAAHARLLSDRLREPRLRKAIVEFRAGLERLLDDELGGKAYGQLMRQQEALFPLVSTILPTWAVANLSAGSSLPFEAGLFDLAIIDEASQCDIPSSLPILYRAKRAVIIGDPNQLRHIATIEPNRDQALQSKFELLTSADQPLYFSKNSVFDLSTHSSGAGRLVSLRDHFRSHADIVGFSNRHWYQGSLRICTDYRRLKKVVDAGPSLTWIEVRGQTVRPGAGGAVNEAEVSAVVAAVTRLIRDEKFTGTVGVVTPFRAQANRIREQLLETLDFSAFQCNELTIDTSHGFQGDERDVIFLSPCISLDMPRGAKYFLSSTGNLFNVAVTRARAHLWVVGDPSATATCGISYLEDFARYSRDLERGAAPELSSNPWASPSVGLWEKPFYEAMCGAGLAPRPQYPVHQYRLDFAILESGLKLNIEVDGEAYHREWNGARAREDVLRDRRLQALGWTVNRFWVYQLRSDMNACVEKVWKEVEGTLMPRVPK